MGLRVYATANKLAFNVCVPIILDLIVCSSGQSSSYQRPSAEKRKKIKIEKNIKILKHHFYSSEIKLEESGNFTFCYKLMKPIVIYICMRQKM